VLRALVCLENSRKFVNLFAFYLTEALTQVVKDGAITYLSLTIVMRIVWRTEPVGDLVFGTEGSHLLAGVARLIIGDDVCGRPKRHTRFCHKNLITCYLVTSKRHNFYPFGKVVDCNQE